LFKPNKVVFGYKNEVVWFVISFLGDYKKEERKPRGFGLTDLWGTKSQKLINETKLENKLLLEIRAIGFRSNDVT
jgi:hypothetical protein